ncbi:hypothetical protein DCC62_32265 [candidate division KSB1 bacterium]|nr:MAG: hypothetical protein DCC62_32265 [candidate division KSB1 bacterium]
MEKNMQSLTTTTYEKVLGLLSQLPHEEQLDVLRKMTLNLQKQTPPKTPKTKTLADLRGIIKNVDFSDEEISTRKHHS